MKYQVVTHRKAISPAGCIVESSRVSCILFFVLVSVLLSACEEEPDNNGITVNSENSLVTTEAGATASFNMVLKSQPTQNVLIGVHSSNEVEGLISIDNISFSPATEIQFTPENWNVSKIIYIQGVDDNIDDGNIDYKIITEPASSADAGYQSLNAIDVRVTNYSITFDPKQISNAALVINPVTPLITSEDGTKQAQIQISLDSVPSAEVTVSISSLDSSEATTLPTHPASLLFNSSNWNQIQTISLFGVDDIKIDGDVEYQVLISVQSADSGFSNVPNTLLTLLNLDDETNSPIFAAVIVAPSSGLITSEAQGSSNSAMFSLRLNTGPVAGETITINTQVNDINEAIVQPSSVAFNSNNWQTSVQFTLSGVDDNIVDGNQAYSVSFSSVSSVGTSSPYHEIGITNVQAINIDDEIAAVSISNASAGLLTSEAGASANFSVVLDAAPVADVIISASSSNTAEGVVSPSSLTFSPTDPVNLWNQPQDITVTGVDDAMVDGSQEYTISLLSSSLDANFDNVAIASVSAVNTDNDTADIAVVLPASGVITTSENLTSKTFSVVLSAAPVSDVMLAARSSNISEATVSPTNLRFSISGVNAWNVPQFFTVTGVDDDMSDGVQAYNIDLSANSADSNYDNIAIASISGFNEDNDVASVMVRLPFRGIVTNENATSSVFSVVLGSMPSSNVTVFANSLDTSEGIVTPSSITFSPNSTNLWNQAKLFSVVGQADGIIDGDQRYSIRIYTSTIDTDYSGLAISNISAINRDVDVQDEDD